MLPLKLLQDLPAHGETISLAAAAYMGDASMSRCMRLTLPVYSIPSLSSSKEYIAELRDALIERFVCSIARRNFVSGC